MHKAIRPYSLHNHQIFFPGLFLCAVLYVSQVQDGICLGSLEFYHVDRCKQVGAHPAEFFIRSYRFFPSGSSQLHFCLEKLSLYPIRKRACHLDTLSFCSGIPWP
jgi:hypothetical protein